MNHFFEKFSQFKHSNHQFYALSLLLTACILLVALTSCTAYSSPPENTHSSETVAETQSDTTESVHLTPDIGKDETNSAEEDTTLLYYVSLVEKLQEEIRILKAENFILSSALAFETEKDESASLDPKLPFTYKIDDGEITILSYTGSEVNITVPSSIEGITVTEIGEHAFSGTRIETVVLPDTVEEIDWFAFSSCTALKSLTAGMSLHEIGYGAFDGCAPTLTLICPKESYLERYGKSFGIAVKVE